MKYIKIFEAFDTNSYQTAIDAANKAYYGRENATKLLIDKMNPPCEEVATDITDIFLEYTDQGIELDMVELVVLNPKSIFPFGVYYPLGWQGKTGKKYYYPTYGEIDVDNKITSIINKTDKLYYDLTFEYDYREAVKNSRGESHIDGYRGGVDWDNESFKHIFSLVHECADYIFKRLNNMYKINVISSICYIPMNSNDDAWEKCEPVPNKDIKTTKIQWILEIS